jgi:hypothetical protein
LKKLLVTLTPAEGKRLIAKGLMATDAVRNALKNGYLCVTLGTTSSYLVEEILGKYDKTKHVAGVIVPKGPSVTMRETRSYDAIFHMGKYIDNKKVVDILGELGPGDVIVKSPSALDSDFVPIILLAHPTGGSIGSFLGAAAAKNVTIMMPASLEKCIPVAYADFCHSFGLADWDFAIGMPVGAIAVPEGIPFTEIEALDTLFGVTAIPIAAGGVNGAEGSVTLFVEGENDDLQQTHEFLVSKIKGEPPFPKIDKVA